MSCPNAFMAGHCQLAKKQDSPPSVRSCQVCVLLFCCISPLHLMRDAMIITCHSHYLTGCSQGNELQIGKDWVRDCTEGRRAPSRPLQK